MLETERYDGSHRNRAAPRPCNAPTCCGPLDHRLDRCCRCCNAEVLPLAAATAAHTFLLASLALGPCKWAWPAEEQAGTRVLGPSASGSPASSEEFSPPEDPRLETCGGRYA